MVDLIGALSNPRVGPVYERLTSGDCHQARIRRRPSTRGIAPDGRRKFGTVSGAIVQVLTDAASELPVREIRARVERLLNSPVSRHSVKSHLHKRVGGPRPLFQRTARGRYRLRDIEAQRIEKADAGN